MKDFCHTLGPGQGHTLTDLGRHSPRRHDVDADRHVHILHSQGFGHLHQRALRGGVGRDLGRENCRHLRRDIVDRPFLFKKMRYLRLVEPERRGVIDRHYLVPRDLGHIEDIVDTNRRRGATQSVETAVSLMAATAIWQYDQHDPIECYIKTKSACVCLSQFARILTRSGLHLSTASVSAVARPSLRALLLISATQLGIRRLFYPR